MGDSEVDQELKDIYAEIDGAIDETLEAPPDKAEPEKEVEEEGKKEEELSDIDQDDTEEEAIDPEKVKAVENGWRPKEEFDGDEGKWVDAGEFNRRTDLFEKIGSQSKVIKSLNKKLDALIKHNQTIAEKTREKTITEIEVKRREAVEIGDTEAFDAAEKELEQAKEEAPALSDDETKDEIDTKHEAPDSVKEFAARSPWFDKDKEMTDYMVFKTQQIVNSENIPLPQAIDLAEKDVKKLFAHKFKNPNKEKPASVMAGNKENRPAKKSISDLTPEQKQVWHALKSNMDEQEFLEQLEAIQ